MDSHAFAFDSFDSYDDWIIQNYSEFIVTVYNFIL